MSWITKLNEAYECGIRGSSDLLPIGFTKKEVKYHVILNADGSFDTAEEFEAKTFLTVPTSPKAESRTGENGTPYPLADQLKFLVCDEGETNPRFDAYMAALTEWCNNEDAPECLRILKRYLEQKTLLQDMKEKAGLPVKYGEADPKGKDAKSMVAFSVHSEDGEDRLWERTDVRESWVRRLAETASEKESLCYATGELLPLMEKHPKVQGNAKLISGKDGDYPFLYKGRFTEDGSAAAVSYTAASKAYNALDWLIQKQGYRKYGLTVVVWNTNGAPVDPPLEEDTPSEDEEEPTTPDTFEAYAVAVRDAAQGRRNAMENYDSTRANEVVILGMEAATDGRMSINYYQEIPAPTGEKDDYIARLENWYLSCRWGKYDYKQKKEIIFTPTPHAIAEAVLGTQTVKTADGDKKLDKSATKQMRALMLRLLACISAERPIPDDVVKSAVDRAVQPQLYRKGKENTWSESRWRETISTTCALIYKRRSDAGEQILPDASLLDSVRDRSYLFGRLLAIADFAEAKAAEDKTDRMTNAVRLMPMFVQRPGEMWQQIHSKLIPYFGKLPPKQADYFQNMLGAVEALFSREDRESDAPLGELFLPGYYSQRQALYRGASVPGRNTFEWPTDRSNLYGCMAAIAENAELSVSRGRRKGEQNNDRAGRTNALRYMDMMVQRPVETWAFLLEKSVPYLDRLGKTSDVYGRWLGCCEERFPDGERGSKKPLSGGFLHGYYVMRLALCDHQVTGRKDRVKAVPVTRDDLFGALYGLENSLERVVMDGIMKMQEENYRLSNAVRFLPVCRPKPWSGWLALKEKMQPYLKQLPDGGNTLTARINALEEQLKESGWDNDEPLEGTYLNCFYRI